MNETSTNIKARLKFYKTGQMRFVGHLDLMRFFQKAIRRAGLPIAYSAGFHPHQILSFALPLGIGITSEGEYLDMELSEMIDPSPAIRLLNEQMAEGVGIVSFHYLPDNAKKAMSLVEAARYFIVVDGLDSAAACCDICNYFEVSDELIITKKTKKGTRQLDLKPLVHELSRCADKKDYPGTVKGIAKTSACFYTTLSSGSVDNIKPELLFSHLLQSVGVEEDKINLGIHRMELYTKEKNGNLVSLEIARG